MTHEERIRQLLERSPGLDDDEISESPGIQPRQQVNQICRLLESRGVIRREHGPRGKIVTIPPSGDNRAPPPQVP